MARFLPRTFRKTSDQQNGSIPFVEPGQTMPKINTSRTISPVVIREQDDVTVSVEVWGSPQPKVTWYIGKGTVTPSYEYQMKQRGRMHYLTILNASEELEDGLFVVASNVVGRVKRKLDIKLYRVLSKHAIKPGTKPAHKSTVDVRVGWPRLYTNQRHKSFGSFGKFETLIDGDPSDEIVEDLDVKIRESLRHHKSTPNIYSKLPSNTSTLSRHAVSDTYGTTKNYKHRCATLPDLNSAIGLSQRQYLAKSTESVHNELTLPLVPPITMDFGGFGQRPAPTVPRPPGMDEADVSLSDLDFYQQYSRRGQGSVSTFLPEDDDGASAPNAASSFHEQLPAQDREQLWNMGESRLSSVVRDNLQEYQPDHVQVRAQNPSPSQGYITYDSQMDNSHQEPKHGAYGYSPQESVLAGNLSQKAQAKKYPKVAPKPKSKKKRDKLDSGPVETDFGVPTYENMQSREQSFNVSGQAPIEYQNTSDNLQQGYHPDQNSSAVLYAPDGTMFRLPMDGEFNPSLVLGSAADKESVHSHTEQHSFAIMANESINLSQGESIQPHVLTVFGEEIDIDAADVQLSPNETKTKKKVVKKVKKRTKSADKDTPVSPGIQDVVNQDTLDTSRGSNRGRTLPPVPREQESHNVYEDIPGSHPSYRNVEYSRQEHVQRPTIAPKPRHLDLNSSGHSSDGRLPRVLPNYPSNPTYNPYEDRSQGSGHMDGSGYLRNSQELTGGHYKPMGASPDGRIYENDIYEDVHRSGGRRPTQPPPPPPAGLSSPPSEEPPPIPTSDLPPSPQLTNPGLQGSQMYNIDYPIPMAADNLPSPQGNSVSLDYSVPVPSAEILPKKTKVRKSSSRKQEAGSDGPDSTSLTKKKKVPTATLS